MLKNPNFTKWKDDRSELSQKVLKSFSVALKEEFYQGLVTLKDKTRFNSTLNDLKIDDETRKILLAAIKQDQPALPGKQAEFIVKRCFRRKVNSLRSLGERACLVALCEALGHPEPSIEGSDKKARKRSRTKDKTGAVEPAKKKLKQTNSGCDLS
eukprot:TRINITY_DN100891_c0_g1_i1.p1 TRINITY_DN100891_c0_g1~~TRINITY_DN100891_c0_g1_i1.p1  ORF type:complete len:155 (-),score=19.96 TRINITY_DN100891_c0_g1_i1:120-584(-)